MAGGLPRLGFPQSVAGEEGALSACCGRCRGAQTSYPGSGQVRVIGATANRFRARSILTCCSSAPLTPVQHLQRAFNPILFDLFTLTVYRSYNNLQPLFGSAPGPSASSRSPIEHLADRSFVE